MSDKKECVAGHYCRLGVTLRSIINVDLLVFGIMMMKKSRVRAVFDTHEGLPGGFIMDDASKILGLLKTHNSKERLRAP